MDRMSPLDASFLFAEDGSTHTDVGMVLELDGPPMSREEVVAAVRGRLLLVPRYRQRIRLVPGASALPVWVDDAGFDLDRHVVSRSVDSPGDDNALFDAVSEVMSTQLDRTKPLWEIHVLTGLADDRWALVVRMHHAMVDGVASTAIVGLLLTDSPDVPEPLDDDWVPEPEPSDWQLLQDAFADNVEAAAQMTRRASESMTRPPAPWPTEMPRDLDLDALQARGQPVTDPTFNGPIGPTRRWQRTSFTLDEVRRIRSAFEGTVNDVLLSVCAKAFRALLLHRGEPVTGRALRTLVPVAVRTSTDEQGQVSNRISGMPVELPVGELTAEECLDRVHAQTQAFKALAQAVPAGEQVAIPGAGLPVTLSLGSRLASVLPSFFNTVTSNVPGPQHPMYLHGRRLASLSACISLWAPVRVAVSVLSYDGALSFAVVADRASFPDLEVLMTGAEQAMADLVAAAAKASS